LRQAALSKNQAVQLKRPCDLTPVGQQQCNFGYDMVSEEGIKLNLAVEAQRLALLFEQFSPFYGTTGYPCIWFFPGFVIIIFGVLFDFNL
jgi:hypothetical protein